MDSKIFFDIYDQEETEATINRLNKLSPHTIPNWGQMNPAQMLAHLNIAYDIAFKDIVKKPNFFMRLLIKFLAKPMVVGPKLYPKNGRTAPIFVINGERDFEKEKKILITNMRKTQQLGRDYFEGKENPSFGPLTSYEWSNLFSKHICHHFSQFGI